MGGRVFEEVNAKASFIKTNFRRVSIMVLPGRM